LFLRTIYDKFKLENIGIKNAILALQFSKEAGMNIKAWLKYLVYILVLSGTILVEWYVIIPFLNEGYYRQNVATYFYLAPVVIKIGIGIILGLDHFFNERKKEGVWKINLPKMILFGLPSLYFSFSAFVTGKLLIVSATNMALFQLILGFTIITSFYKQKTE